MAEGSLDLRTVYDVVGGMPAFEKLVDRFYEGVVADEVLRPMYVEEELSGAKRRLALFLAQYWGGPTTYMEERGHPRLRMRHFPFPIGVDARDRWIACMSLAMDTVGFPREADAAMREYFVRAATHLMNRAD
jgi:hemoglobin